MAAFVLYVVILHSRCVRTQSGEYHSNLAWSGFIRIRETPEFFLVYPGTRTANLIPKMAFEAEQQVLLPRFVKDGFAHARLVRADPVVSTR